jgi:secreted PhoX family phosphatase
VPPLATTPDANNLLIPQGFTSRVIAQANRVVPGTTFLWHTDPDGAAVFPAPDGGWVYASNCEFIPGGVNAIRFDRNGAITSAYNVLPRALTRANCGGGVTPWGTWLSGEETDIGYVWECDPFDPTGASARRLDGLGTFTHEAATVDPATNIFYLTEDMGDGAFYRFVPATPNVGGVPSTNGVLQALKIVGVTQAQLDTPGLGGPWPVEWVNIANPNPLQLPELPPALQPQTPTRVQGAALGAAAFDGAEGIWCQNGVVYFTTKGDRRVYAHDVRVQTLEIIYDDAGLTNPIVDSVDNIVMTPGGDIVIVEDKGDPTQQATAIQPDGSIAVLVQLVGQDDSEVTGPAFSPDGRFFYFSSQRGPGAGGTTGTAGITYCIEGPWFTP